MNYSIRRPSGHVIKRGQCADMYDLYAILDQQLKKRGGYLEAFNEDGQCPDVPVTGGGISFMRVFTQDYWMRGRKPIREGAVAEVLSINGPDVHVDLYAKSSDRRERFTFPRRDFMSATKPT